MYVLDKAQFSANVESRFGVTLTNDNIQTLEDLSELPRFERVVWALTKTKETSEYLDLGEREEEIRPKIESLGLKYSPGFVSSAEKTWEEFYSENESSIKSGLLEYNEMVGIFYNIPECCAHQYGVDVQTSPSAQAFRDLSDRFFDEYLEKKPFTDIEGTVHTSKATIMERYEELSTDALNNLYNMIKDIIPDNFEKDGEIDYAHFVSFLVEQELNQIDLDQKILLRESQNPEYLAKRQHVDNFYKVFKELETGEAGNYAGDRAREKLGEIADTLPESATDIRNSQIKETIENGQLPANYSLLMGISYVPCKVDCEAFAFQCQDMYDAVEMFCGTDYAEKLVAEYAVKDDCH